MKRNYFYLLIAISVSVAFSSCNKNDDPLVPEETQEETVNDPGISEETLATNKWITENMELYYLWNNNLPNIDHTKEDDPEAYFYDLLYDQEDKWSWITDDYASLAAGFSGVPVTMGYDPLFYLFSDGVGVFAVVNYVYPGSAAEEAGLKRGDIILSINNTGLDTANYYDLYSGSSYSVQLGALSGDNISYSGVSFNLTARVTTTNPAIYHDVLEVNGSKIAYLVYVEFVAGDNDLFLSALDDLFIEFEAAGISDLIIDLRYNPGGEIDAATYLASEIAPKAVVSNHEVLVSIRYNDGLQQYLESNREEYADYLSYKFKSNVTNINMQRVYFLTTSGTASASELLISGLEPYMDVVHIGEPTYGKYTGAWVMPDDNEQWAMMPIVLKYSNVNGYSDFVDGLLPDYEVEDDLLSAVPFGDLSDPMLAKAVELATGEVVAALKSKSAKTMGFKKIVAEKDMMRNLFVPAFEKTGQDF